MAQETRKQLLFSAAALLRLAIFFGFPLLPEFLAGRVEISTPVSSFRRCTLSFPLSQEDAND